MILSIYSNSLFKMFLLLWINILFFTYNIANMTPSCRDENNQIVDWYVLYKLPKISNSNNSIIRSGLGYLYITNKTVNTGWQLSKNRISEKNSIPGNTLAPLYNDSEASKIFWILYNDSPPNKSINGKYGHAKGVILVNKEKGYWLIHSVPNYPPESNSGNDTRRGQDVQKNSTQAKQSEYDYPSSGKNYGQSFLCISINNNQFDLIGQQLMYNQIIVYKKNIPTFAASFPNLTDAANQKRIKQATMKQSSKIVLSSSNRVQFLSFAKTDKWGKDLYDELVAPTLRADLLAETWLNGRGRLPSDCNHTKSSRDHSKWAVTFEDKINQTWICIGDINRADTQYLRGGGTVCFNHKKVWENYRHVVEDMEPCPNHYVAKLI